MNWLLPEYIEDILPLEANRIEGLRRAMLDLFRKFGYELVQPPLLEYVESLLTGTGRDMDLRTFKLVDQLSGRMMGLRADITPQVARIDAHLLNQEGSTRLCYCGSVLHTLPQGLNTTRQPIQIGAEVYGHAGIESDIEIVQLMVAALQIANVLNFKLDLGHVGIFKALVKLARIEAEVESAIFNAIQSKDKPYLQEVTAAISDSKLQEALRLLPELYGGKEVLNDAERQLPASAEIKKALSDLQTLLQACSIPVNIDLADLRGYHYHTGVVFAVYCPASANAIALGGRYDDVGKAFGRARAATGFSIDLREIAKLSPIAGKQKGVRAPYVKDDAALEKKIAVLREQGESVIQDLPGQKSASISIQCDRELVLRNGEWEVINVN